jgi:hypothetical protein
MNTHAVAVVNWQCASRVVCFDCRREWSYFDQVDAARAADGHRARMASEVR